MTEASDWLLANGACPDACDCYNVSALMKASYFGHVATVRTLLKHGANPSRIDMYGAGALAKAAYRGHAGVVSLLLAAGARTDGEDLFGNRPLHSAVASGHRDIAMMLLQYGAKNIDVQRSQLGSRSQRSRDADSPGAGSSTGARVARRRGSTASGDHAMRVPPTPALLALSS